MPLDANGMIEIQLNETYRCDPTTPLHSNYSENILFHKRPKRHRGFPYGQYESDFEDQLSGCELKYPHKLQIIPEKCWYDLKPKQMHANRNFTKYGINVDCIRQMYCPECQQRLGLESFRQRSVLICCLPFFPNFNRWYLNHKRDMQQKVICCKCGTNLGYWKYT